MIADDPGPAADSLSGQGKADPAAPGLPAPADHTDSPEAPERSPDNGADTIAQTATVTGYFDAKVAAHTAGIDGSQPSAKSAIRRESGMLAAAQVSQAPRYCTEPDPFGQALQVLSPRHLVALAGAQCCGKKAGQQRSLALPARAASPCRSSRLPGHCKS